MLTSVSFLLHLVVGAVDICAVQPVNSFAPADQCAQSQPTTTSTVLQCNDGIAGCAALCQERGA